MRRGVFPGVVACLLVCGPARAGVRVDGATPFAADELSAALASRGGPPDVVVVAADPGAVQVQVDGRTFRITLGGARGRVAARIVAAHVADLRASPSPSRSLAPTLAVPERGHLEVSASAGLGGGLQARDLLALRVAAELRGGGTWRWMAGIGWIRGAGGDGRLGATDLGVARTGLGLAVGRLDMTTGPLLARYHVDGGAASGWTPGWHGGVRLRAFAPSRWRIHATLDGEWLQHRVVVRVDGEPVAATPRVALSAGLSVGWELAP
jgi:hypothetical protein